MATIGIFRPDKDGYAGTIRTLSIDTRARIVANERRNTNGAPHFRILVGPVEVGVAWRKTAQEGGASYLAVRIDDPSFPEPIRAALLEQAEEAGLFHLVWRREKREGTRA